MDNKAPRNETSPGTVESSGEYMDALKVGTVLNKTYKLLKVLGQGGFGITYLAEKLNPSESDKLLSQKNLYVIKENICSMTAHRALNGLDVVCHKDQKLFDWTRENFLKEARTLAGLQHSHIVRVLEAFEENGTAYFVMSYVEGKSMASYPVPEDKASAARLEALLPQLLRALEYLHGREIIHRDIKPDNILLSAKGEPVLIDFGAARMSSSQSTQTIIGTPGYAPPEQLDRKDKKPQPVFDIYALGATFYHLITGQVPPEGERRLDALVNARPDPIPLLSTQRRYKLLYSTAFLASIDLALRIRKSERWQSAGDWLRKRTNPPIIKDDEPVIIAHDRLAAEQAAKELSAMGIATRDFNSSLLRKSEAGETSALQLLLTAGADVNTVDKDGRTPLYLAVENARAEAVRLLLSTQEIDVNQMAGNGETPLTLAARKGYTELVRKLLSVRRIKVNKTNGNGSTPLREAAIYDHPDVVQLLLGARGIMVNLAEPKGMTPLHEAASRGHTEVVRRLLSSRRIRVNRLTENRQTPLHLAAEKGHTEVVRLLLVTRKASVNRADKSGVTPLKKARQSEKTACACLIAEAGGRESSRVYSFFRFLRILRNWLIAVIVLLFILSIYLFIRKDELLKWAVEAEYAYAVEVLLCVPLIDVNVTNTEGKTPLHVAAESGNERIVSMLLADNGIDLYKADYYNMTPLQRAIKGKHENCAKLIRAACQKK